MPVRCSHCAYRFNNKRAWAGISSTQILSEGKLCHVMSSLPIFNAKARLYSRGLTATLPSMSCIHICLAGNIVIVVVVVVVVIFARPLFACMICASCVRSHDANEVAFWCSASFECRVCLASSASWARIQKARC